MTDLPSWNDTATRAAIEAFARDAPEPRVAVFDNDGTLWCEKPMPTQLDFIGLRLLVVHDDSEREFDYTAGAEDALAQGFTTISVKNDWATVFA